MSQLCSDLAHYKDAFYESRAISGVGCVALGIIPIVEGWFLTLFGVLFFLSGVACLYFSSFKKSQARRWNDMLTGSTMCVVTGSIFVMRYLLPWKEGVHGSAVPNHEFVFIAITLWWLLMIPVMRKTAELSAQEVHRDF